MKQTMENIPAAKNDKKLEDDANDLMFDGNIHFIFTDFILFCRQLCETTEWNRLEVLPNNPPGVAY